MHINPFLTKKKNIHISRFVPTINLGGGARRTVQIINLLKKYSHGIVSSSLGGGIDLDQNEFVVDNKINLKKFFDEEGGIKYWSTFDLKKFLKKKIVDGVYFDQDERNKWNKQFLGGLYRTRKMALELAENFEYSKINSLIIDDPIYFAPLIDKARESNISIIGVCHNLETLAFSQVEIDSSLDLLNREINLYSKCDFVITISREENLILKNLGINAVFLPYYPVEKIENRLIEIRKSRKNTEKKNILLLGNAMNLQMRSSMEKTISFWKKHKLYNKEGRLLVAGYGTEKYLNIDKNDNSISFLGTMSNGELDILLSTVKGCLCYQEKGAGALTRITEMLIAGVPVLANSDAARTHYNKKGIIEFQELNDLYSCLDLVSEIEGCISLPKNPDTSYLLSKIDKIIN